MNYINVLCCLCHLRGPWSLLPFVGQPPKSHPYFGGSYGKKAEKHGSALHKILVPWKQRTESLFEPVLWKPIWNYNNLAAMFTWQTTQSRLTSNLELSFSTKGKHPLKHRFQWVLVHLQVIWFPTTRPLCYWKMLSDEVASDILSWSFLMALHVSYSPCLPVLKWFNIPSCNLARNQAC